MAEPLPDFLRNRIVATLGTHGGFVWGHVAYHWIMATPGMEPPPRLAATAEREGWDGPDCPSCRNLKRITHAPNEKELVS